MSVTELPETYLTRTAIQHKMAGSREVVTDCPECGKPGHCYVNRKTWLWHCKRCDKSGNEYSFKRARGDVMDLAHAPDATGGRPAKTAADAEAERLGVEILASLASAGEGESLTPVEQWHHDLVHSPRCAHARAYLAERGLTPDTWAAHLLGWSARIPGSMQGGGGGGGAGAGAGGAQVATETSRTAPRSAAARRGRRVRPAPPDAPVPTAAPMGPLGWLMIPVFSSRSADGAKPDVASLRMVKARALAPDARPKYMRIAGGDSALYTPGGTIVGEEPLILTGGELDALTVWQVGHRNVASSTLGETAWADGWTDLLAAAEDIVVAYDNDAAGREHADIRARELGAHRTRVMRWPEGVKDANEWLQRDGGDAVDIFALKALMASARSPIGQQVITIGAIWDTVIEGLDPDAVRGHPTGWRDLDALLGGWRDGEVTVVTGDTASGKTTWTSQAALHQARLGRGVLYCPFELGVPRQVRKWIRQWGRCEPLVLRQNPDVAEKVRAGLASLPIRLLNHWGHISPEAVRNTILFAARRYRVRFVVLDHLHFMVQERDKSHIDIAAMLKAIVLSAQQTGVHVLLVAHPHAVSSAKGTRNRDNAITELSDLKGGSVIKQDVDNVVVVWRPRDAERSNAADGKAVAFVKKARDDYANEGSVPLRFDLASATYHDTLPVVDVPGVTTDWHETDR